MTGFDTFHSRLIVSGYLETLTPLRIGAGKSTSAVGADQPVVKDILDRPVIPGSSLKGALRSHMESLLRSLSPALACDFISTPCLSEDDAKPLGDAAVIGRTCLCCRLFGSNNVAAKLALRDLEVDADTWGGQYLLRHGVAIDRDTGTAADKRKYDFEAVPAGTRFVFRMEVNNATDEELGLALAATDALKHEQVQLGGGRSRGLGWCRLVIENETYYDNALAYLLSPGAMTPLTPAQRDTAEQSLREYVGANTHA